LVYFHYLKYEIKNNNLRMMHMILIRYTIKKTDPENDYTIEKVN